MPFWEYPLNKERVPLSSVDPDDDDDDDDEGEDLPPYRDVPLAQSTDGNGGRRTNGRNGGKKTKKKSAHKAITIEEDSSFVNDDTTTNYGGNTITVTTATTSLKFYNDDDDEDDGGFGDGDYYSKKIWGKRSQTLQRIDDVKPPGFKEEEISRSFDMGLHQTFLKLSMDVRFFRKQRRRMLLQNDAGHVAPVLSLFIGDYHDVRHRHWIHHRA